MGTGARVHLSPALLSHGIRADPEFFSGEDGDGSWRRDSATNLRRKAFDSCKPSAYIWLLGASLPDPTGALPLGLCPWNSLGVGTSVTQTPCAHPDFRAWLRH